MSEGTVPVYGANGIIGRTNTATHEQPVILIGCRGSIGQVHVTRGPSYATSNAMALDALSADRVDLDYLARFLEFRGFDDVTSGSSQPQLTRQNLIRVSVPLPALSEQRRIAAILDQADALRTKRREQLALLDALIASCEGEFMAHFSDGPFVPLAEIARRVVVGHVGPTSAHFTDNGVPLLRTGNVGDGEIDTTDLMMVTPTFAASLKKSTLQTGDVLVSRVVTDTIRTAILPEALDGANCANIIVVRPSQELDARTIRALLRLPTTQRYLLGRKVGSAQGVVNTTTLKDLPVPVIPIAARAAFQAALTRLESVRADIRVVATQFDHLFTSLQSRAFRGEL